MDTNIDYRLSNAINMATEQNKIRTKELRNFPICVAIGEVPSAILECLNDALKLRAGELEIAQCYRIEEGNCAEKMDAAVNYYKEKRESGKLQPIDDFYVAIFLMENLMEADTVRAILEAIGNKMGKMGFKNRYRVGIYCFMDFENPASESKILNWEKLFQSERLSVCFFSQQLWGISDLGKYQRAVNAAALHIFLNISLEDWKLNGVGDDLGNWKVLGYWKLDIFKYVIAEQLENYLIKREEKSGMEKEEYIREIEENPSNMLEIDEKKMRYAFQSFPIHYSRLERVMNTLPLLFGKNSKYTYRNMLEILYGDEAAFYTFLKENIDYEVLIKKIPEFMDKLPGNIADVELRVPELLDIIEDRLSEKRRECLSKQRVMDTYMQMTRNIAIQELVEKLFQDVWGVNQEWFQCELQIWFVGSLKAYLGQDVWRQKLEAIKAKNRDNIAFLRSIKRDAIPMEEMLKAEQELQAYIDSGALELKTAWNQDILDDGYAALLTEYIRQMGKPFEEYMKGKDKHIFTRFVTAVKSIRQSGEDKFYTAYMDSAKQTLEYEYIFVNGKLFGGEEYSLPQEVNEKVKIEMPFAKIKYRKWVDDANIELLAFKELETIRGIYGMHRKGEQRKDKD